jgi:trans-aconitate 2-methyltransferase
VSATWDAKAYERISDPQVRWAAPVIDRLDPRPGELVLDAGCGTGRVTELLVARGAEVLGVDADPAMIEQARRRGLTCWCQDLLELEVPQRVDAVFSNAVFHWVPDHPRLFARLFEALKPGGRLVAQCGGEGNIANVIAAAKRAGAREVTRWTYPSAETAAEQLRAAGFTDVETWLHDEPTTPDEPQAFVAKVILREHEDADALAERTLAELGDPPVLDYVRLNIVARKP